MDAALSPVYGLSCHGEPADEKERENQKSVICAVHNMLA